MSKQHLPTKMRDIVPYVGVAVGILVLLSPAIAHFIDSWRSESSVSQVTTVVEQIPEDTKAELLSQAQRYNEQLATHAASDEVWPYERQLSWDASQTMCWIEIPRIGVRLGVYHGAEGPELMVGAGHVEGTSLPVGGPSTHCAISAHSGMPGARLFDNLHDLVAGDVFVLWTLGEPYAYRVTDSEVVEPDDASSVVIEQGKDRCTLITCTPYGVNSHRLLVHGERCAYEDAAKAEEPVVYVSPQAWPLVAGLVVAGGALALTSWQVVRSLRKRGRP